MTSILDLSQKKCEPLLSNYFTLYAKNEKSVRSGLAYHDFNFQKNLHGSSLLGGDCMSKNSLPVIDGQKNDHLLTHPHENTCNLDANTCNHSKCNPKLFNLVLGFMVCVTIMCFFLFVGSSYIKDALLTLEQSHSVLTFFIFLILFILVSLPLTWGYVLLNLAAGYLYGVLVGGIVVFLCAVAGITTAYFVIKHSLKNCILSFFNDNNLRSFVAVIESRHGFKVIALARLTPIPFGLQNALFGMCRIGLLKYLMASMIGMLPMQCLHTYIGSTLRSMQDVTNHQNNFTRLLFASQVLLVAVLLMYVLKKAREEFDRTIKEVSLKQVTLI